MKELDTRIFNFKKLLPQRIHVQVFKGDSEGEVWAQILDLPHCYTQASEVNNLPEMITDLVLTHFEVPEELRNEFGEYIPLSNNHLRLEEMLRHLIDIESKTEAGKEVKEVFQRTEFVPA